MTALLVFFMGFVTATLLAKLKTDSPSLISQKAIQFVSNLPQIMDFRVIDYA